MLLLDLGLDERAALGLALLHDDEDDDDDDDNDDDDCDDDGRDDAAFDLGLGLFLCGGGMAGFG